MQVKTRRHVWLAIAAFAIAVVIALGIGFWLGRPSGAAQKAPTQSAVLASVPGPSIRGQLALVRQRQDDITSFFNLVLLPLSIVAAIIGAGGLVGIVFSFRREVRSGQMHDLVYAGSSAEQARTQEVHAALLDASQKTLTLVNDTLELARDANTRAAKELSQRAARALREISDEATALFLSAFYDRNFDQKLLKIVVEEPQIRSEVADLAYRLAAIEGPLEFQDIPLTPSAYIVKGLTHHLKQDEKRAIRFFERAVDVRGDGNQRLTQLALYWAGYGCNNVGQYTKAVEQFKSARRDVASDAPLHFELTRMQHESTFFDLANRWFDTPTERSTLVEEVERCCEALDQLAESARAVGASTVGGAIATTAGNLNFWLARVLDGDDRDNALNTAIDRYGKGGERNLWALLGLAETTVLRTGKKTRTELELYAKVEKLADRQTQRRAEQRSLALLYLTTAICRRQQSGGDPGNVTLLLQKSFGDVEGSLTLYSQYWKTNVPRETFEKYDLVPAVSGEPIVATPDPTELGQR